MTNTVSRPLNGLSSIANSDGVFSIVAMDQRNTLKKMFAAVGVTATDDDMMQAKIAVASALSKAGSGILLDPTWGVPAVNQNDILPSSCGLLIAAENPDRGNFNGEPRPTKMPGQDAAWVKSLGGQAVKVLVSMHPGRVRNAGEPDLTSETVELVRSIVADCKAQGIPSVIENLIYPLPNAEPLTDEQKENLIVESAILLNETKPDLLKLEFPITERGCKRLADSLTVPWAVLSAGVAFEQFKKAIILSCDAGGASGFIAGRSIWKEAIGMSKVEQDKFLTSTAVARLEELNQTVLGRAVPWNKAIKK
jgi:tagatose-1,6-bisphosphate aldolase